MKKVFLTLSVAGILLVSMSSCKKDYTCNCTVDSYDVTYEDAKKSDAETACEAQDATLKLVDASASCSLD